MKKIIKEPSSEPPPLMRAVQSVLEPQEESAPKIPPSVLYGSNLKQMKGFHSLRSTMKRDSFLKQFIKSGIEALEPYDVGEETMYDIEIVKFIMQTAEDSFIHYKKQGAEKKSSVIAICLKYFDNNEVLVGKTVEQMLPFIKHSTFLRRNKSRIYNIGMLFLGMFSSQQSKA